MGLLIDILCNKLYCWISTRSGNKFHAYMAWRGRLLYGCYKIFEYFRIGQFRNESILCTAVWKAFGKVLSACVPQIGREFLWIRTPSWTVDFLDFLLLSDKHVAHWYFRASYPWCQWFLLNSCQRISGLQEYEQEITEVFLCHGRNFMDILQNFPLIMLLCLFKYFFSIWVLIRPIKLRKNRNRSVIRTRNVHGFHAISPINFTNLLDLLHCEFIHLSECFRENCKAHLWLISIGK